MTASEADAHKYFTGNIGIADGRIAFAGADPQQAAAFRARCGTSLREIDGRGKVAMPGLVNLHNHVSMSLMRSYADDMPLMPWLTEKIWPFEAKLDGEDIYLGARLGIAEMLLGGTTTFVDMYWHSDRVADAVTETGIRGVSVRLSSGPVMMRSNPKRCAWPKSTLQGDTIGCRSCSPRMPLIPVRRKR